MPNIAIIRERAEGERRTALTPEICRKLTAKGAHVLIEAGAGLAAGFADADYAGAEVLASAFLTMQGTRPSAGKRPASTRRAMDL